MNSKMNVAVMGLGFFAIVALGGPGYARSQSSSSSNVVAEFRNLSEAERERVLAQIAQDPSPIAASPTASGLSSSSPSSTTTTTKSIRVVVRGSCLNRMSFKSSVTIVAASKDSPTGCLFLVRPEGTSGPINYGSEIVILGGQVAQSDK